MASDLKGPEWQGRKIAKPEDVHDLESRAAILEFKHRMPREDAEHRAHFEYQKDKHREAAAHHLAGMKAAQGAGSHEEAQKHGMMYGQHIKALGLDDMGPVPEEIKSLVDKQDKFYKFKAHRGDTFLFQGEPAQKSELAKGDVIKFPQQKQKVPSSWDAAVGETIAAGPEKSKVTSIQPKLDQRREAQRASIDSTLNQAFDAMSADPGFQAAGRQRDVEAKAAKLKAGGPAFKVGQAVRHVDTDSVPWGGTVTGIGYRDNDIDGPGHYASVKWWNPKLKQFHEDYLHQENLKPF